MPEIVQVSISRGGIPKYPVRQAMITTRGVEGNGFNKPHLHGGPGQEVLIVVAEVIDDLAASGFPVVYGSLGENLTIRGVPAESLRAGQTWRAGDAILELTKIRTPCATLDVLAHPSGQQIQPELHDARVKQGDYSSPLWAKSGFYASVRRPGLVTPGAPFELLYDLA
jgi:MOSC domain-containing protein YiiM